MGSAGHLRGAGLPAIMVPRKAAAAKADPAKVGVLLPSFAVLAMARCPRPPRRRQSWRRRRGLEADESLDASPRRPGWRLSRGRRRCVASGGRLPRRARALFRRCATPS